MSARPLTELKGGSLNRIFSDGHTVIKLYFGNDRRGVEKLVREINFLQSLPVELKKYFPNILYSGKEADGAWYAMPHYNMITITKHILSENLNANDAWAAIKNVLKFMTNKVYVCNVTRHIPKTYVAKTQFCRVMESLKILKNLKPFSKLVEQNYIFLNDQKLTGPDKVIKVLRRDQNILQLLLPDRLSLFHGIRQERAVQVLNYFVGAHNCGELTDSQRINLLTVAHELGRRLKTVPDSLRELYNHSLKEKVEACVSILDGLPREAGQRLISDPRYKYLTTSVPQVLVHYDLHRSNVLFAQSGDVKILDLGDMIYSPADFLPASLFMSFFLLQDPDRFNLDELTLEWPQPIHKSDIILLMQARAIIGLSFFYQAIKSENPKPDDVELHQKYLKAINWLEDNGH